MIDIYELDEEELLQYAGSQSEEVQRSTELDEAMVRLENIKKAVEKTGKEFTSLKGLLKRKQFDESYDKCAEIGIMLDRASTRIKTYPFEIGEKSSNKKIRLDKADPNGKKLSFVKDDGYMRIILPEMLPHKQQYDASTGKMRFYYDIDSWKATYYQQFLKEFEFGKFKMFDEKVSICYMMHVSSSMKSGIADTDNYDTKVMTDIIAMFLLHDDNFICCNYLVDIVIDEQCLDVEDCFTEIVVCPSDRREVILKELGY